MLKKNLPTRAKDAFGAGGAALYADAYIETLVENWREVARRTRTAIGLLVVAMATFQLLHDAQVTEIVLGPARVTDATPVLLGLPIVISYLFYECVLLLILATQYEEICGAVVEEVHPAIAAEGLQFALAPPTPSLWGQSNKLAFWPHHDSPAARRSRTLGLVLLVAVVVAACLFEAYAFIVLFDSASTLPTVASLAISSLLVARAYLLVSGPA